MNAVRIIDVHNANGCDGSKGSRLLTKPVINCTNYSFRLWINTFKLLHAHRKSLDDTEAFILLLEYEYARKCVGEKTAHKRDTHGLRLGVWDVRLSDLIAMKKLTYVVCISIHRREKFLYSKHKACVACNQCGDINANEE